MPVYQLVSQSPRDGLTETLQFEASNASTALSLTHRHQGDAPADLWCEGILLCNIEYNNYGFWTINGKM